MFKNNEEYVSNKKNCFCVLNGLHENICTMDVIMQLKASVNARNCIFSVICFICNCMIKNNINVAEKISN